LDAARAAQIGPVAAETRLAHIIETASRQLDMRIGIIGAGQLGQMLGFAAADLGIECRFVDPSDSPPAADAGEVIRRPFDDPDALEDLAATCDVVTYEFENVPVEALLQISERVPIYPPPDALRLAQDRLDEKRLFDSLQIPLPGYRAIDSKQELQAAVDEIGLPLVVKTRRLGYDGKGQFVVRNAGDVDVAWRTLGVQPLIVEEWVPFDYEVSAIGVRNVQGDIATYALTHNEHLDGILHMSRAPVDAPQLTALAEQYLDALLTHLDYVGVLALELFVAGEHLLANEFAPRVHNSGHWTMEGAATSQFTNHLLRTLPGKNCWLHDYGKAARPGRKLGHITVVSGSAGERDMQLQAILETLGKM
jgi:5-(carboxyamino)imidazole ribonucleotide synthase